MAPGKISLVLAYFYLNFLFSYLTTIFVVGGLAPFYFKLHDSQKLPLSNEATSKLREADSLSIPVHGLLGDLPVILKLGVGLRCTVDQRHASKDQWCSQTIQNC